MLEASLDVRGGHRLSIRELDVVAQEEGNRLPAVGNLPLLGDPGNRLLLLAETDEAEMDIAIDLGYLSKSSLVGIETIGRICLSDDDAPTRPGSVGRARSVC